MNARRKFLKGIFGLSAFSAGLASGFISIKSKAAAPITSFSQNRKLGPEYNYNTNVLFKSDPAQVIYEEAFRFKADGNDLSVIEVSPKDDIYIGFDSGVLIYDLSFNFKKKLNIGKRPRALAIKSENEIYIGAGRNVELWNLTDGTLVKRWDVPFEKGMITAIALHEDLIFVADAGAREIYKFESDGKLILRFGKKDASKNISGFIIPSPYFDIFMGSDGLLWAANTGRHQIEAYTLDGDFELAWGKTSMSVEGFCGCCNPSYFTRDKKGQFITSEKGIPRIKVYSPRGEFIGIVAGPENFQRYIEKPDPTRATLDVAVDSKDRVFAVDVKENLIRVYKPKT